MEENLLALLEKSRIFSPYNHSPKTKVTIEGLSDYRFFICNCFGDNSDYFVYEVKYLLSRYIKTWAQLLDENPKKEFDWKEFSQNVFDFFDKYDWNKAYEAVKFGANTFTFDVVANKSSIRVKRFGNILAFDILKNGEHEHKTGLSAMKALCRAPDPGNNQRIYELVHKVNVLLSLPGKNSVNFTYVFDFSLIFNKIKRALQWANLSFDANQLINCYQNNNREGIEVGEYSGFTIYAELIHEDDGPGNSDNQNVKIWRCGNVKPVGETTYLFEKGHDILLKLTMKSSLPERFLLKSDVDSLFHREQFDLAEATSVFVVQLCAMQMNTHREIRSSIDKI